MSNAWMVRFSCEYFIQYPGGLLLVRVGLVSRQRRPQQRESIKDRRFLILWIANDDLLHRFLVREGPGSVIDLVRVSIERRDRSEVIPLSLSRSNGCVCLLHRRGGPLQFN